MKAKGEICRVPCCSNPVRANGACNKHETRFKKWNNYCVPIDPFRFDYCKTHGMSGSEEYEIWRGMRKRCYNKNHMAYHNYGGRGISICDEWVNSFSNFHKDMGDRPFPKAQIDRIDNDLSYSKENCRWVSCKVNIRNSRVSTLTWPEVNEIRMLGKCSGITQTDIASTYGVTRAAIYRIIKGLNWNG